MREADGPVAFQGERGAYSELAVRRAFGEAVQPLPLPGLADVFAAVEDATADLGVVPVENSYAGSVDRAYELLRERDVVPVGEVVVPVRHALLALPGVEADDVDRVLSHPQALAQCRQAIEGLGAEAVAAHDTAGSARRVAEEGLRTAAAIASPLAGERYGLDVLARDLQSQPGNRTRFLVLDREPAPRTDGPHRTSLVLVTSHDPGALHEALGPFARRGVNLMKLESRPTEASRWEYRFYLDLAGHHEDPDVAKALEEVRGMVPTLEVLGSYPRAGGEG